MIPAAFGRYSVETQLGAGAMGEVYRAIDPALRRPVALKVLPAGQADSERRQRFVHEAQAASALNHPNIVTIYEVGEAGGRDFIAMELVAGRTLTELAGGKPLPLVQALRYAEQVAEGLAAAHAAGFVHRDLKPANVMVTESGLVKILDFGLAKLVEHPQAADRSSEDPTAQLASDAGRIVGTASYMSPEQAEGRKVDARSDIFGFGCVLYEMLTGARAFRGDSAMATIGSILRDEPAPVGAHAPELPKELDRIVWRCLRKDPDRRFQHIADVRVLLRELREDAEAGRLASAPPGTAAVPRRKTALLAAAAMTGLVAGAALAWVLLRGPAPSPAAPPESRPAPRRLTTRGGYNGSPAISPDGRSVAYVSDQSGSLEIYVTGLTPGSRELALTSDGGQNMEPEWSPDGQWLAYHSRAKGGIWIVPSAGGSARQVVDFGSDPTWSPDGERLALTSNLGGNSAQSILWSVRRDGSDRRQLTRLGEPQGGHRAPSWSHDGRTVAFVVGTGDRSTRLALVAVEGGSVAQIEGGGFVYDPLFSRDDEALFWSSAALDGSNGIWRMPVDVARGAPRGPATLVVPADAFIEGFSIARDGTLVFSKASDDANLWAVDLGPGGVPRAPVRLTDDTVRVTHPDYSHDGRVAYVQRVPGRPSAVWVMKEDGTGREPISTEEPSEWPLWSPDATRLLLRRGPDGRSSYFWIDLATRRTSPFTVPAAEMFGARVSPDGKLLAYHTLQKDGGLNVWVRPLDGGEPQQITFDTEAASFPIWSPDGRWLAIEAKREDQTQIGIVSRNGGPVEILTSGRGQCWSRSWSPDGEWVAAACERDAVWNVLRVNRRTRAVETLTRFASANGYVRYPVWSPRGGRIVFERSLNTSSVWTTTLAPRKADSRSTRAAGG